jgi:hypothetical protein
VGAGNWNQFTVAGGVDVTLNVPVLPLPTLRLDGEVWSQPSHLNERHGNALSLMEVQSFAMGYVGVGPAFYFTDDFGDHKSGFAAKLLGGVNLPGSTFVEASVLLGASPSPVTFWVGKRF